MPELSAFEQQLEGMKRLSDINELLHTLRTYELAAMPRGAQVFVSAGCAGSWYFDWVDKAYGRVHQHIGIEYFLPKPEGLPPFVQWITSTVGDMSAVTSGSADLVFSGQNVEHLWPWDVTGFLLESARILKPNGLLVLDSPNRMVTRALEWRHPQHTMEFTPDEIRSLLSLSGFVVQSLRGMWIVRDPATGRMLPLSPDAIDTDWPFLRRVAAANANPEESFLWWVETTRSGAAPDKGAIDRFSTDLYVREWPTRLRQTLTQGQALDGRTARMAEAGRYLLYGPYVPLAPGSYTATFFLRCAAAASTRGPACLCDVVDSEGAVLASSTVDMSQLNVDLRPISLAFDLPDTRFGVEFRIRTETASVLEARMDVSLRAGQPLLNVA